MPVFLFNPNTNPSTTETMTAIVSAEGLEVEGRTAPFGVPMIVEPVSLARSAEAVLAMLDALLATSTPIDGIIIAAFGDPGLQAVRASAEVRKRGIPICGIGEASFLEAGAQGRRFAVATTTPELEADIASAVATTGMSRQFLGSFFSRTDPFEAVADPEALVRLLDEAVARAESAGAEAVIIGGGPLAQAAASLAKHHSLAIVQPLPAAARLMAKRIAG